MAYHIIRVILRLGGMVVITILVVPEFGRGNIQSMTF